MDTKEQLATLRGLFEMLQSGTMTLHENGEDVTEREIEKLKPDMAYLERVLARQRGQP
jgi:hypothetical protein